VLREQEGIEVRAHAHPLGDLAAELDELAQVRPHRWLAAGHIEHLRMQVGGELEGVEHDTARHRLGAIRRTRLVTELAR